MAKSLASLRRIKAGNPRDEGLKRMGRPFDGAIESMRLTGALTPGYVMDHEIAAVNEYLGDIAAIIAAEISDDETAGRLMRAIGYAIDRALGLGSLKGGHEPSHRLRERQWLSQEKSKRTRAAKTALWRAPVKDIWLAKRGRFPKVGRLRPGAKSRLSLATWILTNRGDIPNLPRNEQSLIDAFREWEL